jgi:hypothetical protein
MTAAVSMPVRPFYFIVVFWGEKYRRFFETLCLPSLLAPANVPVLAAVPESKLLIATSKPDWAALQALPLFRKLRAYIEPVFIELGFPGPDDLVQLHMSKGHKAGAERGYRDKANSVFLAPDLVLSNGTIRTLVDRAARGRKAVLAPALRFDMDQCVEEFRARGLMRENEPLVLPPRTLAAIACKGLHSEFHRFDWDAPHFCNFPIAILVRLPNGDIITHSASWAIVMANFSELGHLNLDSLDDNTIDRHFMFDHLHPIRETDKLEMITDSDDILFVSMTSERDLTFHPLQPVPVNGIPIVGRAVKLLNAYKLLHSDYMDPFMCWMFSVQARIHSDEITSDWRRDEKRMREIAACALGAPSLRDKFAFWCLRRASPIYERLAPARVAARQLYQQMKAHLAPLRTRDWDSLSRLALTYPSRALSRAARRVTARDEFQLAMARHPIAKQVLRQIARVFRLRFDDPG